MLTAKPLDVTCGAKSLNIIHHVPCICQASLANQLNQDINHTQLPTIASLPATN
jgi:hypothetical protein